MMSETRIEDGNSNSGSESRSRSLLSQPTNEGPASHTKEERIESFDNYPSPSPVNPIHLAKAGFYYEPCDGLKFRVVCAGCSNVVNSWNTGDVPSDVRFHQAACEFTNTAGSQGGRSGAGQVKALIVREESTTTKPLIVGRNVPHASIQNVYGHQRTAEEFTSLQQVHGRRDAQGRPVGLSMPTVMTRHTRVHTYHNPETGLGQQTYEEVERTSSHGRSDEQQSPSEEIYGPAYPNEAEQRASEIQTSIPPSITHSYHQEEERLRSQPTTYERSYTSRLENSQNLQTFLSGLDMTIGDNRLHTFQELWDDSLPFRNTRLLVFCGFYCLGQGDAVKCFHCEVVIANWSRNDNPRQRHEEMSPNCLYLTHSEETGDQPLSIQSRASRMSTPLRSMSTSYAPSSYMESNMGSFHSLPPHHVGSISPRRDLHPHASYYPQSPRSGGQYSSQHSRITQPMQPNRGQTALYHGSSSPRTLSPHSSHSRNSSLSPRRGAANLPPTRGGRSPGPRMTYPLSPGVSPHQSRHSSHSPSHRPYPSLIAQPSVEVQPVSPEIHQPSTLYPPPPSTPYQRSDPLALYPCHNPRRPDMQDVRVRQRSFQPPYPRISRLNASYREMAEAGFFYTGRWDRVLCWYCGGGLENFEPNDDIWTEHAKHNPHCEYLLQRRGQQFVDEVTRRGPIQRRVPLDQLPVVESSTGPLSAPPEYTDQQLRQREVDLFHEGMQSEITQRAREFGYTDELIRQVQWSNVLNYGACYQTSQALIDALIDATDAQIMSRTDADRLQQQQAPYTSVAQQPAASQTTTTASTNTRRRQNTRVTPNGIIIDGVPMEQYMANIFDTPFFRGDMDHLFENNGGTTVVQGNVPNITVRRSRIVNNTRRQPQTAAPSQAQNPQAPAAVSTVPPPEPPPLRALDIPNMPRSNNTGSGNSNSTSNEEMNWTSSSNEAPSTSEGAVNESSEVRLERLEREKRCKICLSNDADILFQPCGHICSCSNCAARADKCPVCRARIASKVRTYRS